MTADLSGLRLLSVISLGDGVAGGEGLVVHAGFRGRRTLFVAAEHAPADFVAVDVTDPRRPSVVYGNSIPTGVRSNNLAILGDLLAVTRQARDPGGKPAGVEFFDIADPARPRSIGFFDASGQRSVGTHFVWLAADGYAYLATQAPDYAARDPRDTFILSILDVSDPSLPREAGRWWPPGVAETDTAPPPARPAPWDFGFRVHNTTVLPEQPGRAFVATTSGGAYILDISDRSRPGVAGSLQYAGPLPGAAHTFVPLGSSGFAVLTDETLRDGAADFPQNTWVVDARVENRPLLVGSVAPPWPDQVPVRGRYGAHNLHEYPPDAGAWRSFDLVAGAFFGLGVAVWDFSSPLRPRELGHFAPGTQPGGPVTGQLNDVFIDDRRVIYTVDRRTDLCYVLELGGD